MELENIQVCVRLRPLNNREKHEGESNIWRIYEGVSVMLNKNIANYLPLKKTNVKNMIFNYDRCFNEGATNENIYNSMVHNLTQSCLKGINATVFMYGQTGSGKTYTMLGYDSKTKLLNRETRKKKLKKKDMTFDMKMKEKMLVEEIIEETDLESKSGLLIQSLKHLFDIVKEAKDKTYFIKCSYVEIYNDQVYDLLQRSENFNETLMVCEDAEKKEFYIRGVRQEIIDDWQDAIKKLKMGEINRHYARTVMNHSSSRSHTIFRVYVQSLSGHWAYKVDDARQINEGRSLVTESWLNFVDLAGSEKVSAHEGIHTKFGKERIKEGKHINKSLFFLTQVIKLKSEGRRGHIPYRNSPLTKILRSSLGGNSRTVVVLCVNPTFTHLEQSLSTFRFGLSAKKIENNVTANVVTRNDEEAVRIMIADYEKKLREYEREKNQYRYREKTLMNRILELEKMENGWITKLKATQSKTFRQLTESLPSQNFEELLKGYKKYSMSHYRGVGLIMMPSNNDRYEKFCRIMKSRLMEELREADDYFLDADEECFKRCFQRQDGALAFRTLEKYKQWAVSARKLKTKVMENWVTLNLEFKFQTILTYLEKINKIGKDNIHKVEQLVSICKEEFELSGSLQKRLELLEGASGFGHLQETDLRSLKALFESNLSRVNKEINRREFAKELQEKMQGNSEEVQNQLAEILKSMRDKKADGTTLSPSKEDETRQEEIKQQQLYFAQLKQSCIEDKLTIEEIQDSHLTTPPKKGDFVIHLFRGTEDLLKKANNFDEGLSEEWGNYLRLKAEVIQELKKTLREESQLRKSEAQQLHSEEDIGEIMPHSLELRNSWLQINRLIERKQLEEQENRIRLVEAVKKNDDIIEAANEYNSEVSDNRLTVEASPGLESNYRTASSQQTILLSRNLSKRQNMLEIEEFDDSSYPQTAVARKHEIEYLGESGNLIGLTPELSGLKTAQNEEKRKQEIINRLSEQPEISSMNTSSFRTSEYPRRFEMDSSSPEQVTEVRGLGQQVYNQVGVKDFVIDDNYADHSSTSYYNSDPDAEDEDEAVDVVIEKQRKNGLKFEELDFRQDHQKALERKELEKGKVISVVKRRRNPRRNSHAVEEGERDEDQEYNFDGSGAHDQRDYSKIENAEFYQKRGREKDSRPPQDRGARKRRSRGERGGNQGQEEDSSSSPYYSGGKSLNKTRSRNGLEDYPERRSGHEISKSRSDHSLNRMSSHGSRQKRLSRSRSETPEMGTKKPRRRPSELADEESEAPRGGMPVIRQIEREKAYYYDNSIPKIPKGGSMHKPARNPKGGRDSRKERKNRSTRSVVLSKKVTAKKESREGSTARNGKRSSLGGNERLNRSRGNMTHRVGSVTAMKISLGRNSGTLSARRVSEGPGTKYLGKLLVPMKARRSRALRNGRKSKNE